MFKILVFLVRKPGTTLEQMREHYETKHLPWARRLFPQILEHRRNYLDHDQTYFPPSVPIPRWDCITEIWFADRAGYDAMMAASADPVFGAEISADGSRFLDTEKGGLMIVEEAVASGL